MGGDERGRSAASTALIRGVVLIVGGVLVGVLVLISADPSPTGADRERAAGPTTTAPAGPDDDDPGQEDPDGEEEPPDEEPAEAVREPDEYSVVVANGSGVDLAATRFSEQLAADGFQTATPTNAERVEVSILYFAEGYEREAAEVAAALDPPPELAPLLGPPPVEDAAGAQLVLVVGPELANTPS